MLIKCCDDGCASCGSEPDWEGEVSHPGWISVPWYKVEDYSVVRAEDRDEWLSGWAHQCPHCKERTRFELGREPGGWSLHCHNCYDCDGERSIGHFAHGKTPMLTIADWNDWVEDENHG